MMSQHGMRFNHQNSAQIGPPGTLRLSPSTMNGHPSAMVGHPMHGQPPSPHGLLQQHPNHAQQAPMAQHSSGTPAPPHSSPSSSSIPSPGQHTGIPQPATNGSRESPRPVASSPPKSTSTAGTDPGKDGGPLNMTLNSDIRTNSIAALRIKAKEHLENINKGLTIA